MNDEKAGLGESGSELNAVAKIQFTNLQASSFILGDLEHPNKMPFSGVLTYFDAPSDQAPHGSGGRKVMIPSEVGVPALESLVGMAVNYVEGAMDGHSPTDKIGVITEAYVSEPLENGAVPVYVGGFIYAYDFQQAAVDIKLNQASLGFSYETANTLLVDGIYGGESVAVVTQLGYFTGASILFAAEAAYTQTSLAASADDATENTETKEVELPVEGVKEILEAINSLKEYVDTRLEVEIKAAAAKPEEEEEEEEEAGEEAEVKAADEEGSPEEEAKETPEEEAMEEEAEVKAADGESDGEAEEEKKEDDEEGKEDDEKKSGLNAAADLKAELEAVKAELATLKASAEIHAAARKSIVYPTSLMAKYELDEKDEATALLASIEKRDDLSVEERLALKFELREKARKNG